MHDVEVLPDSAPPCQRGGQCRGRAVAVDATSATADNSVSYTSYVTITYTNGAIAVSVPKAWGDTSLDGVWKLDDKEIGISVGRPSIIKPSKTAPGQACLSMIRALAKGITPDQLLDR